MYALSKVVNFNSFLKIMGNVVQRYFTLYKYL